MFGQQATEDVEAGGISDCFDSVNAPSDLRVGAGEIDGDPVARPPSPAEVVEGDGGRNPYWRSTDAVVVEKVFGVQCPAGNAVEKSAHHFFGIFEQVAGSA